MTSNEASTKAEPEKALDYLGEVRNKLMGSFSRSAKTEKVEQVGIEHSISVIRAILAVNSTIFSRCMKHAEVKGLTRKKTQLTRFGFETIKTRQEGSKLELVTQAGRFVQTFDTHHLSTPPSGFDEILVVNYKPFTVFVDFEDLFCKTLLLNDDALEFLLPKLKEHLESVQVCLGELDEWALQTVNNVLFIKSVFEKECTMPMEIVNNPPFLKCWYCGSSMADGFVFGSAINLTSPSCSKEVIPSVCTPNRCKQVHVLAEFNVSFIYRDSFDVSHESEQMKLRRFLYFIKGE